MSTVKEAKAFLKNTPHLTEKEIRLIAEQVKDRTSIGDQVEVRAIHCFAFWKNGKPFAVPKGKDEKFLSKVELTGQVLSMNGHHRFAAMAGEIYAPGVEWVYGRITGIKSIYVYRDVSFRDKTVATIAIETERYLYLCIQPDEHFETLFEEMCAEYKGKPKFIPVDWKGERPFWWRHLPSWLAFKKYARERKLPSSLKRENKKGDTRRPDDEKDDYSSDSETEKADYSSDPETEGPTKTVSRGAASSSRKSNVKPRTIGSQKTAPKSRQPTKPPPQPSPAVSNGSSSPDSSPGSHIDTSSCPHGDSLAGSAEQGSHQADTSDDSKPKSPRPAKSVLGKRKANIVEEVPADETEYESEDAVKGTSDDQSRPDLTGTNVDSSQPGSNSQPNAEGAALSQEQQHAQQEAADDPNSTPPAKKRKLDEVLTDTGEEPAKQAVVETTACPQNEEDKSGSYTENTPSVLPGPVQLPSISQLVESMGHSSVSEPTSYILPPPMPQGLPAPSPLAVQSNAGLTSNTGFGTVSPAELMLCQDVVRSDSAYGTSAYHTPIVENAYAQPVSSLGQQGVSPFTEQLLQTDLIGAPAEHSWGVPTLNFGFTEQGDFDAEPVQEYNLNEILNQLRGGRPANVAFDPEDAGDIQHPSI
ncbi:hypothetical protein RhiJN_25808 [Ceratobasidium sp. AG-Ba]|nr:hypothetical protein RhiJN_25808 [Ceratobasidium sp. AG-Ba]